jgi:4-hydroxyacetophenone monooxygenase
MSTRPDTDFIRRAVELADLNAVRVALYQQTKDPELKELPMALAMDDAQRELLVSKAVAWLEQNSTTEVLLPEPPEDELRELCNLATKEEMSDVDFNARRELPAFNEFPWFARWNGDKPQIPEGFHAVIVGSGFSGLAAAIQMSLLGVPYTVIERRPEPGGTWTINRYPDIRVDTISITYEYNFEKNFPWTEYFGRGPEVRAYLDHISTKYGVKENTRFSHDLKSATWNNAEKCYDLVVDTPEGEVTMTANYLINAVGKFANPNVVDFPGRDSFDGLIVHPSRWPEDLDLTGKRVAIIGNGSTGVQMLQPIAEDAEQVFVFQRTPQWISPRPKYGDPIEPEIRWLLDNFPGFWHWWRYMAIAALFQTHKMLIPDEDWKGEGGHFNQMNDGLRDTLTAYIKDQVNGDPDLIEKLTPDYAPFSRRPVVDNGWYKALTRDNVELVTDPIREFVPTGVETEDGTHYPVDVIVTATGFQVEKYLWPADYIGDDGVNVHDFWSKDGARAYLGMMVPHFPNMFVLYGPNSQPLSGGTGLPAWYVIWSAYAGQLLVEMLEQGKSQVSVTEEAYWRYNEALDEEASKLLLLQDEGAPDKNYYVNTNTEQPRLQTSAPWYGPDFHTMCTEPDWNDLQLD